MKKFFMFSHKGNNHLGAKEFDNAKDAQSYANYIFAGRIDNTVSVSVVEVEIPVTAYPPKIRYIVTKHTPYIKRTDPNRRGWSLLMTNIRSGRTGLDWGDLL